MLTQAAHTHVSDPHVLVAHSTHFIGFSGSVGSSHLFISFSPQTHHIPFLHSLYNTFLHCTHHSKYFHQPHSISCPSVHWTSHACVLHVSAFGSGFAQILRQKLSATSRSVLLLQIYDAVRVPPPHVSLQLPYDHNTHS